MRKAYLKCHKIGGDWPEGEYLVSIECADGSKETGVLDQEHFDTNGNLEVSILEERGEKTIILLPRKLGNECAEIKTYRLTA